MNEKERILKLLKEGRISSEEAVMLLEAIEEPASAPRGNPAWVAGESARFARDEARRMSDEARRMAHEASQWGREIARAFRPNPPQPPMPPEAPNPPVVVVYGQEIDRPEGLQWLRARLSSSNLTATLDAELERPAIEGDITVREVNGQVLVEENHGSVRRKGSKKFAGITVSWDLEYSEGDDATIRLPIGWGLECEVMSGDLHVEGLPFVRGRVMSGDVSLEDIHGIQLRVDSGEFNANNLILSEGNHSLEVLSGDVHLNLVNSSVRVKGKMTSGDLDAPDNFVLEGTRFEGVIGDGAASLSLKVMSGDVSIEAI